MSMISNETVKKYAEKRNISIKDKEDLEKVRAQIWREKGFERINGKWKKIK